MQPYKYNPNNHSGKFNHRITLQKLVPDSGKDEDGFPIEDWQDVTSVWAMIKTLKGSEFFAASSTQNQNSLRFVVRYAEGLHPDMRIFYKDRTFDIESIINDDEANKTLTIIVKEAIK